MSGFTDFFLSGFPIYLFRDLGIGKREKVILCILMGIGFM